MPSSDPSEVTLYKLTSETVWTGRGYPPMDIDVQIRSAEDESMWFSRDLNSWSENTCSIRRQALPVYHCVRAVPQAQNEKRLLPHGLEYKTERYYFAIEPALKEILEIPFRDELRNAQEAAYVERNKALAALKQQDELFKGLARATLSITTFQIAPLYRRLWIALRPVKHWPQVAESTTSQKPTP